MGVTTNYLHTGPPRPDGHCPTCNDQVTTSILNQSQRVDISDYGRCGSMTILERLEIDLEHAEDRVRAIQRQIARAKR